MNKQTKLMEEFELAIKNFKKNPSHDAFKEFARAAAKVNPHIIDDLRHLYKMPIRSNNRGKIKFGNSTQEFNTVPFDEIERAVENITAQELS